MDADESGTVEFHEFYDWFVWTLVDTFCLCLASLFSSQAELLALDNLPAGSEC
eukprot:SAG11_NODE_32882_length_280_cov_0.817680_1_plen_52_part_10